MGLAKRAEGSTLIANRLRRRFSHGATPPTLYALNAVSTFQAALRPDKKKANLGHTDQNGVENRLQKRGMVLNGNVRQIRNPDCPVRGVTLQPVRQQQIPDNRRCGSDFFAGEADTVAVRFDDGEKHLITVRIYSNQRNPDLPVGSAWCLATI